MFSAKKVMRKEVPNVPNFKKLKSLQLGGHRSNLFNLVAIFLLMSPNLRKLSLRIYPVSYLLSSPIPPTSVAVEFLIPLL